MCAGVHALMSPLISGWCQVPSESLMEQQSTVRVRTNVGWRRRCCKRVHMLWAAQKLCVPLPENNSRMRCICLRTSRNMDVSGADSGVDSGVEQNNNAPLPVINVKRHDSFHERLPPGL